MRPTSDVKTEASSTAVNVFENLSSQVIPVSEVAYHELAEVPVQRTDLIEQVQMNLKTMTDLQSRMNFMMREIRYLMKV